MTCAANKAFQAPRTVESMRVRNNVLENPNAIVAMQVGRSNDANVMGERERRGESDNGQKVQHVIVALREIADKS